VYQTIEVIADRAEPEQPGGRPATEDYRPAQPDVERRSPAGDVRPHAEAFYVMVDGDRFRVPNERVRFVNEVPVLRPFGPWYAGYGNIEDDVAARYWLRFTGITMRIFHELTDSQLRRHEQAQIDAATAPVNEAIRWKSGVTSGSVRAVREFEGPAGNRCREFEHIVTVGKKIGKTTGTACRDDIGVWWLLRPA
jgi:hypothetical protein